MGSEPPNPAQSGTDWSLEEVAAAVTDYFAMLSNEIAGRLYNKREHNHALQAVTGRSAGSIEFKHQNIGAFLAELGLPWLRWVLLIRLQRPKPRIESPYDTTLNADQAGSQPRVSCRVHSLRPRGEGAERSIRRILARKSHMQPTGPNDAIGSLILVLEGIAEPICFARQEELAAAWQVEPAGSGAGLRTSVNKHHNENFTGSIWT